VLEEFARLDCALPNLFVGTLTRDSVQRALARGVTADDVIGFLQAHAHPQVAGRVPSVPEVRGAPPGWRGWVWGAAATVCPPAMCSGVVDLCAWRLRAWQLANRVPLAGCAARAFMPPRLVFERSAAASHTPTHHLPSPHHRQCRTRSGFGTARRGGSRRSRHTCEAACTGGRAGVCAVWRSRCLAPRECCGAPQVHAERGSAHQPVHGLPATTAAFHPLPPARRYSRFEDAALFEHSRAFAEQRGLLLWGSSERQCMVVTHEGAWVGGGGGRALNGRPHSLACSCALQAQAIKGPLLLPPPYLPRAGHAAVREHIRQLKAQATVGGAL
jgi:hypothetical protein